MRAMEPRERGYATNPGDGVRSYFEVFGPEDAGETLLLLPSWSLVHGRIWKMQVPFFARAGYRVVTFDGRGNGRSDAPRTGYRPSDFAADAVAVMEATGVDTVTLVGFSAGGRWATQLAVRHARRVDRVVLIGPSVNISDGPRLSLDTFLEAPPDREEWHKYNAVHWREDLPDFRAWFATKVFNEPHSTKGIDDIVAWSRGVSPESLTATVVEGQAPELAELWPRVACEQLIVQGSDDQVASLENSRALQAAAPHAELVVIDGGGHAPHLRDPVKVNLVIQEFLDRDTPRESSWRRANSRRIKRALFVSSPIGLGHAQRDLAIARELRALVPGLEVDWLAQHPVTTVLRANNERIHPASVNLTGESPHIEGEMGAEHELNVFQAIRDMDEILLANFHVFHDVAKEGNYDLWVGDEAWEVDYYLHENPELKTAPFAWLTDFVGFLPMVEGDGGREAFLTADYNAEMIEQVERFKRVRDASIYIGEPSDVVPGDFGPGLPVIKEWVSEQFAFNGYIRYFDPAALGARAERRARFGFGEDERVVVVAVGGTSVGSALLRRIVASHPQVAAAVEGLRLIVVCGPRIDSATLPQLPGVEYRDYVHNLYELLAAADAALVQGGLSTTMELVAAGTPFLYFPLTHHFEQNRHVAHRLDRYGAPEWTRLRYPDVTAETLGSRLARLLNEPPSYHEVAGGGARAAAERIAGLL